MEYEILFGKKAEKFSEQCGKIFDDNNKDYIVNRDGIFDHKKFNLLVLNIDGEALAYQLIYIGGDFVKQETYDDAFNQGFKYENDAVYIWDMCTKKGFENKGYQQALIKFLIGNYPTKNIYSLTDINNKNSMYLQEKLGFISIGNFVGHHGETYAVLKKPKTKEDIDILSH